MSDRRDMMDNNTTAAALLAHGPREERLGLPGGQSLDSRILLLELLARGFITADRIETALSKPNRHGQALERVLIDEGAVSESDVLELMSELYNLPLVELTPELLDVSLTSKLPLSLLEEYCIYPLRREPESDVLPLATADPFDMISQDVVRQMTGRQVRLVLASKAQIKSALSGKMVSSEGFHILVDQVPVSEHYLEGLDPALEAEGVDLSENAAPIIKLVNSILFDAIRKSASDIHIEPQESNFRVRYRIDGILFTAVELPKRAERTCISRVKIIAGLDISESRKAQDGRLSIHAPNGKVHMRVSTIPGYYGEKIVLRILDQSAVQLDLSRLGLAPDSFEILSSHLASSSGMILITGPTGSGKTSTLYAALRLLNDPSVNIVTVEDPIEFQVAGLTQVSVNAKAGVTFASALRAFLRQDPDIIMVGEIRDLETAEIAIQAAQTGHLVFSTLHTNDAPGTLSRLVLMGVEAHSIADSLLCVVAQRLVRKLCPHCRVPGQPKPEHATLLKLAVEAPTVKNLFEAPGCEECGGAGYKGRLGLYEILTVTSSIRQQMLMDSSETALWNVARSEGMVTLLEDGLRKVELGITSLEEVLRVVTIRRKPATSQPTVFMPLVSSGTRSGHGKTIRDIMTSKVTTVTPGAMLKDVTRLFVEKGITGCPVVSENGKLIGMISLSDLASQNLSELGRTQQTVREVMSSAIISIGPEESIAMAAQKLWRHRVHRLPVLEDDRLVGIVTALDLVSLGSGPE